MMASKSSIHTLPSCQSRSVRETVVPPLSIIAAGLAAYLSSFSGVFLFDDRFHILGALRLKTLWPLGEALARRRPVVDYSLAINHALGGDHPWLYHATNLAIHVTAALTLYGVVRRTLIRVRSNDQAHCSASWTALGVALIWLLHPLQTQAVTYVIQRAESLMGLFYLLTLYCVIRSVDSPRRLSWSAAAIVCCFLGMGSKAVMVTAPVVILLYDRAFLSRSLEKTLRRRWGLYLLLAGTWSFLWISGTVRGVLSPSTGHANVGFGFKGISALQYLQTECGVIVAYLKLSFWPHPLCLDYQWPIARGLGDYLGPALIVLLLLLLTVWAFVKKPSLGFAGVWFFLILAPTSSFIPIKDPLFEHRMYLSLAGIIAPVVILIAYVLRRSASRFGFTDSRTTGLMVAMTLLVTASLGFTTYRRNAVYQSESGMWRDVWSKKPHNARAADNLGKTLLAEGRLGEALAVLQKAVKLAPDSPFIRNGLGQALATSGRYTEAINAFQEALRLDPHHQRARVNLGKALAQVGRVEDAMNQLQVAVRDQPNDLRARLELGNTWLQQGKTDEAIRLYRELLQIAPRHFSALRNLGSALMSRGDYTEAVKMFQQALRVQPDSADTYDHLAIALVSQGKTKEAERAFQKALQLKPDSAKAHGDYAKCLLMAGDLPQAVDHYRRALAIEPYNANFHYELGVALAKQGQRLESIAQYRQALQIDPGHANARTALDAATTQGSTLPN